MTIEEVKKLAQAFIDSPADQGDEKLELLAASTLRMATIILSWRGDFTLNLDSSPKSGGEK